MSGRAVRSRGEKRSESKYGDESLSAGAPGLFVSCSVAAACAGGIDPPCEPGAPEYATARCIVQRDTDTGTQRQNNGAEQYREHYDFGIFLLHAAFYFLKKGAVGGVCKVDF